MWRIPDDNSKPVITAAEHIQSAHCKCRLHLPETAVVFFMGRGVDYLVERYHAEKMAELFPRFLNRCPIWEIKDLRLCFLNGSCGDPQAADTVETLAALGVKNIIAVGMCGAYDEKVCVGEVIAPQKAFVEEGTSLHYYGVIEASYPDTDLLNRATSALNVSSYSIVTTDAVYRQTFYKERLWREKGAVGVDMETSAVFSVAKYLDLKAAALLMVSDIHPIDSDSPKWQWQMTEEMRYELAEQAVALAKNIMIGKSQYTNDC